MITLQHNIWSISKEIAAPQQVLWDIITDTEMWSRWGPSVTKVESTQQTIVVGSCGRVKTIIGIWVPFLVTSLQEPHYWRWHIGAIEATGHRLTKLEGGTCKLTFELPWWAILYAPVCCLALRRIQRLCLGLR